MLDIRVRRYPQDPEAQGVIEPADKTWQLVIDKEGYPVLYVTSPTKDDQGNAIRAYVAIDDFLEAGLKTKDIMKSEAIAAEMTPEEEAAALAQYEAEREAYPIPCPR